VLPAAKTILDERLDRRAISRPMERGSLPRSCTTALSRVTRSSTELGTASIFLRRTKWKRKVLAHEVRGATVAFPGSGNFQPELWRVRLGTWMPNATAGHRERRERKNAVRAQKTGSPGAREIHAERLTAQHGMRIFLRCAACTTHPHASTTPPGQFTATCALLNRQYDHGGPNCQKGRL